MVTRTGKSFQQPEQQEDSQLDEWRSNAPAAETPVFSLFRQFPAEIRRMIWREAIQEDRIVEISSYDSWRQKRIEVRFTSRTIVPPLLHACSESRSVVTAPGLYEKLVFGGRFTGTYINYHTDIIMIKKPRQIHYAARFVKTEINASAMEHKCRNLATSDAYGLEEAFRRWCPFPNLERIVFIQSTPSFPGTEISGDGNLKLVPITEEEISTFGTWRLQSHRDAVERISKFHKRFPNLKRVDLMAAIRGPEKRYSASERAKRWREVRVVDPPPPRRINFNGYRLLDLRHAAVERGITSDGLKKDLVERLEADEETRFARAMEEYNQENEPQTTA